MLAWAGPPTPSCCRPETGEKIQTKITSVPLPKKCAHPPFLCDTPYKYPPYSEGKVRLRRLELCAYEDAALPALTCILTCTLDDTWMNIPVVAIYWKERSGDKSTFPPVPAFPPPFRIHFSLWSVADSCADQSTSCYAKGIWPVVTHCHRSRDLWLFLSANDAFWLGWFVFRQDRGRGSLPCARGQRWSVVKEV